MRIEHMRIDGFGQFSGFDLTGFGAGPGLTVVHGPNEAGKSTLRHFLRWMLFGPSRGDIQRWTGPQGRLGGEVDVRLGAERARLVRQGREVELRRPGGVLVGAGALAPLIAGMDRALFDAIFTFDLLDLQRIEAWKEEHVQNLLAVGATLGAGAHPAEIVQALDGDASAYWRPRSPNVRIREAQAEIARIEARLRTARDQAVRYGQIVEDAAGATRQLTQLRARSRERAGERRETERLRAMLSMWERRSELVADVATLGGGSTRLPTETRQRLDAARHEARRALEAWRVRAEAHDAAVAARDAVMVDEALLAHAATIDGLFARLEHVTAQADEGAQLRQQAVAAEVRARTALDDLGEGWDERRLAALRLDARVEAQAKRHMGETAALAAQVPGALAQGLRESERVAGELATLDAELATLREDPAEGRLEDIDAVLVDASARLEDVVAEREAQARVAALEAQAPEGPGGDWPEVGADDIEEARRHATAWRDAATKHQMAVRTSEDALAEAGSGRDAAAAARAAALAMPGAEAPGAEVVSRLEARWSVVRDELALWRQLDGERKSLEVRIQRLPARVGGGAGVEALAAPDTSADGRGRVGRAFDAMAAAERACGEARAADEAAADAEVVHVDGRAKAAAAERRDKIVATRAALDDFQRAREGAPQVVHGRGLPWIAVVMLVVLVVVAAVLAQRVVAGLSLGCAVVMAVAAWRQRRSARSAPAPDAVAAEARWARMARDAGFEALPGRPELEVALEGAREAVGRFEREEMKAEASATSARRASTARAALELALEGRAACASTLAAVLQAAGLPAGAERSLADAWLDAAEELRAVREQLRSVSRQQADITRRADELRAALRPLVADGVDTEEQVAIALAGLRQARTAAEEREAALRAADARVTETERGLAVASERAARVAAQVAVPEPLRAAWATWLAVKRLPQGEPDAAYVARVQAAHAVSGWRRELSVAQAAVSLVQQRVAPFLAQIEELGRVAGIGEACDGRSADACVAGLRAVAAIWRAQRTARAELRAARRGVIAEQERVVGALAQARARSDELETLNGEFSRWCEAVSAPDGTQPAGAAAWLEQVKRARALVAERETVAGEAGVREAGVARLVGEVVALAESLGAAAPRDLGVASLWLRERRGLLEHARVASAQRAERTERASEAKRTCSLWEGTSRRLAEEWRDAALEVGCADEIAWEQRLAREEQLDEVEAAVRTVEAELRGAFGGDWDDEGRWAPWRTGGLEALDRRIEELDASATELQEEDEQVEKVRGELQAQATALETASEVVELSTALESARTGLEAAQREWWRLRIARHLLQETFERFRRERQPAVLRQASAWFAVASAGAYGGLEVDEESSGVRISVRSRNGAVHAAEELSTGTTGILYLCLRLALAADQAQHTAPVPVLLDDVLAHFDPERAAAAARLLVAVAASAPELQLVLFTCRPESVACVRAAASDAVVLEMERWAGADGPVARAISKAAPAPSPARVTPSRASAASVSGSDASDESGVEEALKLLNERAEPLARADFMEGLGLGDSDWNALRPLLEDDDRVEVSGARRGRRYALA